ncbi:MAG: AraC family transcriptional regulator [Verrucomicrobiae bacterium]|nr:AraC family transcriptional regulator [Verrucomicrobiae bacterium]
MQNRTGKTAVPVRAPISYPDPSVPVVAYTGWISGPSPFHVHTDEDWELIYIASGSADYRLRTGQFQLQAGDLLVIGPEDPHVCLAWRGERFVAIFHRSLLRRTGLAIRCGRALGLEVEGVRIPSRTHVVPWRRTAVEYLLDRLHEESFGGQRAKGSMCVALVAQLLLELARSETERCKSAPPPDSSARRVVERLAAIVEADLAYPWTLGELVRRSGYSSTQLTVLFRRVTGLSPCQWISQERVHRACQLLAHTDKTIVQIAAEVGFGTRSQFHRVFRHVTGTTPQRYRSALRHETLP